MEEYLRDKNNEWYKLGKSIGENPVTFIIAIIIILIAGLTLGVGAVALEGLVLYGIELLIFPMFGLSTTIAYWQCCLIVVAIDIIINTIKNIFKRDN